MTQLAWLIFWNVYVWISPCDAQPILFEPMKINDDGLWFLAASSIFLIVAFIVLLSWRDR